jgi:hypothetical protein
MGERLDRNINRAVRKGDARSAAAFNSLRQSISGQGFQGTGGITNADDREQRVADGTIKGAKIRSDFGNIGRANNGMIAEAPPEDSVTPKNRLETPGLDRGPSTPGLDSNPRKNGQSFNDPMIINGQEALFADLGDGAMAAAVADRDRSYGNQDTASLPKNSTESFTETEARKRQESASSGAFGSAAKARADGTAPPNAKQQFAADLDRSTSIKKGDGEARDRAYQRGDQLDVSREQIQKRMGWETDAQVGKKKYDAEFGESDSKVDTAIANLGPGFSPEQIAAIRKNMAGLTPQQRKDAGKQGKESARKTVDNIEQDVYELAGGDPVGLGDIEGRAKNASERAGASVERTRKVMADLDASEKDRIAKYEAGKAASADRLKTTQDKNNKAFVVQKKQSADYFSDLEKNTYYNASLGNIKRLFMDQRADPARPEDVDYDTFDPDAKNMGQKQPLYQSAYGGPDDTYNSLGVEKDSKGNRNIVTRVNESYYGPTTGWSMKKDAEGNRSASVLKPGKQRSVAGNLREYRAALDEYASASSRPLLR